MGIKFLLNCRIKVTGCLQANQQLTILGSANVGKFNNQNRKDKRGKI